MMTIMLTFHVLVATIMTLMTSVVAIESIKRSSSRLASLLLPSLGLTAGSGIVLAIAAPHTFGRFCVTMTVACVAVVAVKKLYAYRLQNSL